MKRFVLLGGVVAIAVAALGTGLGSSQRASVVKQQSPDAVVRADGESIGVMLATDDKQRRRGLKYVRHLPPNRGMLFVYDNPVVPTFHMTDTYVPLDILFVRSDGRIVDRFRLEAQSDRRVRPSVPVRFVLETVPGRVDATTRFLQLPENSKSVLDD